MKEKDICSSFYKQVILLQQTNYFKKPFFIFHIANEQKTNLAYTLHLKKMGLVSGVADYCILKNKGVMFIEFKRNSKCRLTERQKSFQKVCEQLDINFLVTHDIDTAIDFIKAHI